MLAIPRTPEHPIGFPNITDDEMRAAGDVMEEFADLILKSAKRSHDQGTLFDAPGSQEKR